MYKYSYIDARWVAKPANLFDNDIPIPHAACYLLTTSERAKDLAQKPVRIIKHASDRFKGPQCDRNTRGVRGVDSPARRPAIRHGLTR